jgi:hypothetical protein
MTSAIVRTLTVSVLITTVFAGACLAQDSTEVKKKKIHPFLMLGFQAGYVMQTNDFVKGKNASGEPIENFAASRLQVGWQSDGSADWMQTYNFPSYGFGIYGSDYFNDEELGTPSALYGFFTWPLKRWHPSAFNLDVGFGLAYKWKAWDPEDNPYNVAIGAARSVYIDVGFSYEHRLSNRFDILGAFTFTHFSNGSTKQPNYGLNTLAPMLAARYNFRQEPPDLVKREVPKYDSDNRFILALAGGVKNVLYDATDEEEVKHYADKDFGMLNARLAYDRQISHKSAFGGGFDITYDGTVEGQVRVSELRGDTLDVSNIDYWSVGVFGGYTLIVDRFEVPIQLGYYVLRKEIPGQTPDLYQRLGLNWYFLKNTHVGIQIRFYDFGKADWIEWTLGQKWHWG